MTATGQTTVGEATVWACPHCLTLYTRGKMKLPDTPRWVDVDRARGGRPIWR